jgi:glycosyltransferase involved in cell wall biosynthesis
LKPADGSSSSAPAVRRRIVMLLSNPATFDQRPLKEAHVLAKAGYAVTILAWDRELETSSDSVFKDGLMIKRMRLRAGHGTPFLTLPKLMLFYLWCISHLLGSRTDVIHCHDVDTLPAGFTARTIMLRRPKLVYDMHDLPEAFLRFFPLAKYTQMAFLASARRLATAIVVVNDRFVNYLGGLGFEEAKLVVVMNAPPAVSGRRTKARGSVFNVLYYGWLGEERGVRLLLDAVKGLEDVTLSLAGRGELEFLVREAAAKNSSIRFLGWLKMNDLERAIADADLIPSLYEPKTRNAMLATPGKFLTAMSLSIPSLVPDGTYQADIVRKYNCGVVVDWKDVEDVRQAISRLATDTELYNRLADASHAAFLSSFSWEVMGDRLVGLYLRLLRSSS